MVIRYLWVSHNHPTRIPHASHHRPTRIPPSSHHRPTIVPHASHHHPTKKAARRRPVVVLFILLYRVAPNQFALCQSNLAHRTLPPTPKCVCIGNIISPYSSKVNTKSRFAFVSRYPQRLTTLLTWRSYRLSDC